MFGAYRLVLALLVLLKHFKQTEVFSGFAVWGFFMLSGFLITGILNTRYDATRKGMFEFAFNRALRLMPTYWLSVVIALMAIGLFAHQMPPTVVNDAFEAPASAAEWIPAVLILGGTFLGVGRVNHSPSPSAWAVEVEILMYLISAWWMSRSVSNTRRTAVLCLVLFPVLWLAGKLLGAGGFDEIGRALTYSFLPAALLPYAIGALLWHGRHRIPFAQRFQLAGITGAVAALVVCGLFVTRFSVTAGFILALPAFAYLTRALSKIQVTGRLARFDTFFGHMSYPVYLLHWVCEYVLLVGAQSVGTGVVLYTIGEHGMAELTVAGFGALILLALGTSALVAAWFEVPIERQRRVLAARMAAHFVPQERASDA